MKQWAQRFADQLFKDNLQLVSFEVDLLDRAHVDEVASRLRELGCKVEFEDGGTRLKVDCPHSPNQQAG
jgi:hypothetical protein